MASPVTHTIIPLHRGAASPHWHTPSHCRGGVSPPASTPPTPLQFYFENIRLHSQIEQLEFLRREAARFRREADLHSGEASTLLAETLFLRENLERADSALVAVNQAVSSRWGPCV